MSDWCEGGDSNPYTCLGRQDLNLVRLPISPPSQERPRVVSSKAAIILHYGFTVNGRLGLSYRQFVAALLRVN